MRSLPSYFEHIKGKTYLDTYPLTIVKVDEFKDKILVEFGGGRGNDIKWLVKSSFNPKDIFFIEIDDKAYKNAVKDLGGHSFHLLLRDCRNTGLKDNCADFVYANNMFHCLETKDNIISVIKEAFRILHNGGALFGRTLLNEINEQKLQRISNPRNKDEKFALLTTNALKGGILIGLLEEELKTLATKVGFTKTYTELKPWKWKPTTDFYFRFEK